MERHAAPRRAKILFRAARMLEEQKEELARLMTTKWEKILKEARGMCRKLSTSRIMPRGKGGGFSGKPHLLNFLINSP